MDITAIIVTIAIILLVLFFGKKILNFLLLLLGYVVVLGIIAGSIYGIYTFVKLFILPGIAIGRWETIGVGALLIFLTILVAYGILKYFKEVGSAGRR